MCYCNPSIRTHKCFACFDYLINKVAVLQHENSRLFNLASDNSSLQSPKPIIACKDCHKINWDLLNNE
jgi:hypothetical protein